MYFVRVYDRPYVTGRAGEFHRQELSLAEYAPSTLADPRTDEQVGLSSGKLPKSLGRRSFLYCSLKYTNMNNTEHNTVLGFCEVLLDLRQTLVLLL